MRNVRHTAALLGLLLTIPAISSASIPQAQPAAKSSTKAAVAPKAAGPAKAAVHATRGVVKSVDAGNLVITTSGAKGAKGKEMTFVLNSATQQKGTPAVGASVQVRYRTEAKQNIATAVSVQEKK